MKRTPYRPATIALRADLPLSDDGAVAPAICQSVSYVANGPEDFAGRAVGAQESRFYGRHGNPTAERLAKVIADLEGAEDGMILSSGMGAITTAVLSFVSQGEHVVAQTRHYSATASFLTRFLPRCGVGVTFVDHTQPDAFAAAVRDNTKLMILESPVNPLLSLTDLRSVTDVARANDVVTLCDNTFASPMNQRPLEFGVDIVAHSATKYIGGHHDLLAGAVVGSEAHINRIWDTSMDLGPIAAPFDAWLALRGIRTLKPRTDLHNANALRVAKWLEAAPGVSNVRYPGLPSHPQHDLARAQMSGFGGVLAFDIDSGFDTAAKFVDALALCLNAPSLGGVDTLVVQPAVMFKARMTTDEIRDQGISPGTIRMSVGLEDIDDLIGDIDQALAACLA